MEDGVEVDGNEGGWNEDGEEVHDTVRALSLSSELDVLERWSYWGFD